MSAKLSISVTDAHAKLIEDAVASGQYASASEVVRAALRGWTPDFLSDAKIDQAIEEGLASALSDPDETIDDIIAEAKRGHKAKRRA